MSRFEEIKFDWGKLEIVSVTEKFSIGIDTILPGKNTDKDAAFLKKGRATYYVLQGSGLCGDNSITAGNILELSEGKKLNIKNTSTKNLVVMTIYTPPYNETNIG